MGFSRCHLFRLLVMTAFILRALFLSLLGIGFANAWADPAQGGGDGHGRGDGRGRGERMNMDRGDQNRNSRHEESRPSQDDAARRQPRLSPEERQALRQQINEAGKDLYPGRR